MSASLKGHASQLLIVHDDDHAILEMLRDLLSMLRYRVVGTSSSLSPHTLVFGNGPDLCIIDLMLSGRQNGIEFAQALREMGVGCPLIAMSASPMLTALARESGLFAGVIDKPFNDTELLNLVEELLAPKEEPC